MHAFHGLLIDYFQRELTFRIGGGVIHVVILCIHEILLVYDCFELSICVTVVIKIVITINIIVVFLLKHINAVFSIDDCAR